MNKPVQQIMDDLEQPDTCLCLNKNSCCVVYGYKPIVDYIVSPIINKFFKPIGRRIKQIFFNCSIFCESCSLGCFKIVGKE